ncbi:hypothetical protein KIN20_007142 [Parelaphostrongylus tenuis]|uniref:Uncharacterized protein n=1 Tax=Parelaphostrongylus tenuis TaxID=148309 RepID=A0AAD5QLR0_PARTN|nr:hypothetical protein KIN20_007142 [Parelaphostrongylus tenuis]
MRSFTVTGFSLPVIMVYNSDPEISAQFPSNATSFAGAQGFVSRLVMQAVSDIPESQARSALLEFIYFGST